MKHIFFILMTIVAIPLRAQIGVQTLQYSKSVTAPCQGLEYDLKYPLFNEGENESLAFLNDTVADIVESMKAEETLEYSECDSLYPGSYETHEVTYEIAQNSKRLLSFYVNTFFSVSNGHINDNNRYCITIDRRNNGYLTIDSLFDNNNRKKVEKLMRERNKDNEDDFAVSDFKDVGDFFANKPDADGAQYLIFQGLTLDADSIHFFFRVYYGGGNSGISDLHLPLAAIKKYLRKEYRWICENQ